MKRTVVRVTAWTEKETIARNELLKSNNISKSVGPIRLYILHTY